MITLFKFDPQKESNKYLFKHLHPHRLITLAEKLFNITIPSPVEPDLPFNYPVIHFFVESLENKNDIILSAQIERFYWFSPRFTIHASINRNKVISFNQDQTLTFIETMDQIVPPAIIQDFIIDFKTINSTLDFIQTNEKFLPPTEQLFWIKLITKFNCSLFFEFNEPISNHLKFKINENEFYSRMTGQFKGKAAPEVWLNNLLDLRSTISQNHPELITEMELDWNP